MLIPREHGTYGELLCPLLSALMLTPAGRAGWGLAGLALGGFLAHESLAVLAGRRGTRALRNTRRAAWRSLTTFGVVAIVGALVAWPGLSQQALAATTVALALSVAAVLVTWTGREHTFGGEALAALALIGWCVPIGLAGGLSGPVTLVIWIVWTGVFATATCAVRVIVARTAQRPTAPTAALGLLLGVVTIAALMWSAETWSLPDASWMVVLPALGTILVLATAPMRATHLRQVGWSIMAVSLLTLALVVSTL